MRKIGVVGAGFSGAVIARELALNGYEVTVFDSRTHVAGNCHTERDKQTNIMTHKYGPHIFHTNNEYVWNYVQQFDKFQPFVNRVKSVYNGRVYSLPINLMTINTFFEKNFNPKEAELFISSISDKAIHNPQNFEEQALRFVGKDLYEAFFKGYTEKQWGLSPRELPASILKRLPIRFNYDDNYYSSRFQGIPENGYTHIVQKILEHSNITVLLGIQFSREQSIEFDHVFYSGPIDSWFGWSHGRLGYRTLDFKKEYHSGDYQGNAVINYGNKDIPFTRVSEHKHFSPWEQHKETIIYKEYSRLCGDEDIPYYPIRLNNDKGQLLKYIELAELEENITFVGRLGTYRYLDMHITIEEALQAARAYLDCQKRNNKMPSFCVSPV
ncbi:UDP-galactopyranose mutase [Limnobacter sp. SAORIC-580]|uniref:UDP-galactopyranose mutase n=2 Tax=Limnobacter profundi TaxID=2732163 RepID=A0ABX6N9T1_9BURK|nr:UDP-galactopyranose mutase [Limnobacter sp. SAORIC-580]QJR31200.1 UDP-galactopyranose mutase [Limnobacter sp. SAORIC-580]